MFDGGGGALVEATIQCLVVLFVLLGLLFLGSLIPALSVIRRNTGMPERKKLTLAMLAMSEGALGIVLLCSLTGETAVMRAGENSNPTGSYVCLEAPISAQYKIQVTRLGNGQEWASLVGPDRRAGISPVRQFAIVGDYFIGIGTLDEYFWIDLTSGAYRYLSSQDKYVKALELIGITQPLPLSPTTDLCRSGDCKPCAK